SDHPPLFLMPAGLGSLADALVHQDLIRRLGNKWSIYGLVTDSKDADLSSFATIDELVRAEIAALRTVQANGPYSLIGVCAGGRVAYEVARTLVQEGERVDRLLLLDTPLRFSLHHPVHRPLVEKL